MKNNNVFAYYSILSLLLAFIIAVSSGPNMLSNYIAASSVISLILFFLFNDKRAFFLAFFAIYGFFGQIISLLIIEHGWMLIELGGLVTKASFALLNLALTAVLFLGFSFALIKISIYNNITTDFFIKLSTNRILYYLPVIYLVAIFVPILLYGPAYAATGGNRIAYRALIPDFFSYLFQIRALIFPLAGLYVFNKRKALAICYILAIVVWNFLIGEKASGIIVSIYSFLLPYVLIEHKKISNFKIIFLLAVGVIFVVSSIIFNYVFVEKNQASFILDRMSMQGQLWWYYYNLISDNPTLTHNIVNEFTADEAGLLALMKYSMPTSLYEAYTNAGYILTSGFPAIYVFYFGKEWLIATLLTSFVYIIPVYFLTKSLYRGNILSFLISIRVFTSLITLVSEGSIASFLDYKLFIYIAILLFLQYMPRLKS